MTDPVERGLGLARAGRFLEAHEAFEEAWRAAAGPRKAALQALVHACVAREHERRGNATGARLQTEKARARLASASASADPTDPTDPLLVEVRRLLGQPEDGHGDRGGPTEIAE